MQIFLGIDPGLNNTGWGMVEYHNSNYKLIEYGVLKTKISDSLEIRLSFIFDSIFNLIQLKKPDKISMEKVFVNINPLTSEKLIMARTAAFLAIAKAKYNVIEFFPNEIKKAVTNNGRSNKKVIKAKVQQILNITDNIKKFDATDALAVAICIGLMKK